MARANGNHEETQLAIAPPPVPSLSQEIENVLLQGDLSRLTADQRLEYYNHVCRTLKLNPLSKPFAYITLNGKLQLYALKDCTDQLRKIHGVSVEEESHKHDETLGIYVVTVSGHDRDGRRDAGTGVVNTAGLKGDSLANAIMKAETKAKRRFTLSICGLGMLDESELESMPGARNHETRFRLPRPPARRQKAPEAKLEEVQEVKAEEAKPQVEVEELKPQVKVEPSFRVRFWRAAKLTGKTEEEIRQYIGWMGYEKTADIPEDKQQECLDWAASG